MRLNRIDQFLGRIRFRWHRIGGAPGRLRSKKEYGLVPDETIFGSVSLLSRNAMASGIDKDYPRSEVHYRICDDAAGWENDFFFVDRFFNILIERFASDEHQ